MSRNCGKAAPSSVVEAQLRCGWGDCDIKFALDQFSEFKQHVYAHVQVQLDERCRNDSSIDSQSDANSMSCRDSNLNGKPERVACSWWGCSAQFHVEELCADNEKADEERWTNLASQLAMHMSVHIYHARLMAIGEQHIERERAKAGAPVDCKLSRSCDGIFTQLQRAGSLDTEKTAFRCGWVACSFETRAIYTFFSHVASHADSDESMVSGVSECETAKRMRGQADSSTAKRAVRRLACGWSGCAQSASVGDSRFSTGMGTAEEVQNGRTFTNAYRLVEHLRTHTAERVAACSRCGAAFSSLTKLRDHFYAQLARQPAGVGEKPEAAQFGCTVCPKRFAKERLLRDHIRKHLNMFKCARCGLTCTSSSSVRRHIVAVHLRRGDCDSEPPAEGVAKKRTMRSAQSAGSDGADAEAAGSQSEADCDSVTSSLPELSESGTDSDTESASASASASAASSKRRKTASTTKKTRTEGASRRVFECHLCAPAPATTGDRSIAAEAEALGKCARGSNGRFLARDAGQFRFLRGAQLTHHLMVAHAIDYPTGHRRFRYSRDADGVFRLSAVRYETELLTTVDVDAAGQVAVVDHGTAPRSPAASSTSASVSVSASASASAAPCETKRVADDEGASEDDEESETESSDGSSGSLGSLLESASDRFGDGTASVDVNVRDPFRLDFDEVGSQITFTYDESEYD